MPSRRDCLSAAAALGALALAPSLASGLALGLVRPASAGGAPSAARAYLVGGWVLTAADLARLAPGAPLAAAPAIPLAG